MRAQCHAAVSALFVALVVILISLIGMQVIAMHASGAVLFNPLAAPVWVLQNVATVLVLGYAAGLIGWLTIYLARRSGAHRLAAAQTWIARR